MSENWLEARVVHKHYWTDALFSLRVEGPQLAFEAGQFVRIGLDIDGERVARPFSFVNPPSDPRLDFSGLGGPGGRLPPRGAGLAPGESLFVASNPAGFL